MSAIGNISLFIIYLPSPQYFIFSPVLGVGEFNAESFCLGAQSVAVCTGSDNEPTDVKKAKKISRFPERTGDVAGAQSNKQMNARC